MLPNNAIPPASTEERGIVCCNYSSPLGEMLLAADSRGLAGAWFTGQKYFPSLPSSVPLLSATLSAAPVLSAACRWLDAYFAGRRPDSMPPLSLRGTPFQMTVWQLLQLIPYGTTTTYGALAASVASHLGRPSMSAQAVGNAIGRNPVSIFVPCHRVVAADGNLTGYAGGLWRKEALLQLEKNLL